MFMGAEKPLKAGYPFSFYMVCTATSILRRKYGDTVALRTHFPHLGAGVNRNG
jgi:hypothetical protein